MHLTACLCRLLCLAVVAATLASGTALHAAPPAAGLPGELAAGRESIVPALPDALLAMQLFQVLPETQLTLTRQETPAPSWKAEAEGRVRGIIGSTWELVGSTGYSGRPLDVLIAVTPEGLIAGAQLMRHSEPVLTLGISDAAIADYVGGFRGYNIHRPTEGRAAPDVIARATVTTGVIRDSILRTARLLAGVQGQSGLVDRVAYVPADWADLVTMGALTHARVTMAEAAAALPAARPAVVPSESSWFEMWVGVIDTPTAGGNLLGQQLLTRVAADLHPGEALLGIFSRGLQSHRGSEYQRAGRFDRIEIAQDDARLVPVVEAFSPIPRLAIEGAPELKERSVFRFNADPAAGGIDLARPFRLTVVTSRAGPEGSTLTLPVTVEVNLPDAFRLTPSEPELPLWQRFWVEKRPQIAIVAAMLTVLGLILFGQEWLVRRPALWRRLRLAYLATTLVVLGWFLGAQLSVVQVIAFLHALLFGFRWETFLIAPLVFLLWSAVALGMLFWGRGVFCGWLCPFGALQELTNAAAQRLGVRQIAVPQALHERLWVIKYTLFVGLVALSFYSMEKALVMAEVEPFKTAISLRFMRPWPFVLFVAILIGAGLFIERFYCRYLCPLGAGLALPAKLKIFDWLKRRPQCGRECRLCETKCTVGAIDPLGRINANECILCLRCQVIMNDEATCPVLKRRARGGGTAPSLPTAPASPPMPAPLVPTQVPAGAHDGAADAPPALPSGQVTP